MSQSSPKGALIRGAAWTVGTRWAVKALGFVSTIIMARLLMPADYGIVAMAMLVVGLSEALIDLGVTSVLLGKAEVSKADIDSCWTLRLMQTSLVGTLIILASWPAAHYFEEPRVQHALWVFGCCVAISGAGNIGTVLAQREFNFALGFRVAITSKLAGAIVMLLGGWWLGDYRALIGGVAAGYLGGFAATYLMHPYRPKWDTSQIREIWRTSRWIMFSSVAGFVLRKGDEIAAGRVGTTESYGQYNVGADLGQLPTGEVGPAMLRAFLPVLSSIQHDAERMRNAVLKTIGAVNSVTLPIGLVFAVMAPHATELLLGAKWIDASKFVALFAIVSTLLIVFNPIATMLFIQGHARLQTIVVWIEFVCFAIVSVLLVPYYGLFGLAYARVCGSALQALLLLLLGDRVGHLPAWRAVRTVLRPLAGALLTALLVHLLLQQVAGLPVLLRILACVAVATPVYVGYSFLTWAWAGRPEGVESTLLDFWRKRRGAS